MSFSLFSNPAASSDASTLESIISRLRAEHDAAPDEAQRGILLHEIAILEELARDDGQAGRDFLAAFNARPEFHEPLERLVVLMERRKAWKNLGKLVERLTKVAETKEETAHAWVSLAELREDSEEDHEGAREALLEAVAAKPDDAEAWLSLEHLAAKLGDSELRAKALAARADLASDPAWKALLLIDQSRLAIAKGDPLAAIDILDKALTSGGSVEFAALGELERIAQSENRPDLALRAISGQAELIDLALSGSSEPRALGVPEDARTPARAADAWLRAAELHGKSGDSAREAALLEKVVALVPDDPAAAVARLQAADASGDLEGAATLARAEIDRGIRGPAASALWMRITEAAAARGDATTALAALHSALQEDRFCIPARALELHLLSGMDATLLAQALESAAGELGSPEFRAELLLLAADTWARSVGDSAAAKEALSKAAVAAAAPELVARTARALSAATGNSAWFDEATRQLIGAEPSDAELASLWFELGRTRLLRGDRNAAGEAFAALSMLEPGEWLGSALQAYVGEPPGVDAPQSGQRDAEALEALAGLSTDEETARGLRLAAAMRFRLRGAPEEAARVLARLTESDAQDLVAATASATLATSRGDAQGAASALAMAAEHAEDPSVSAALALEAGIGKWNLGDREGAVALFELASKTARDSAAGLLSWALRATSPDDPAARRKALDAAVETEDRAVIALERFGLQAGSGGNPAMLPAILEDIEAEGALGVALRLAEALTPGASGESRSRSDAFLRAAGAEAAAIAKASVHFASIATGDDARALASAVAWAEADPVVPSALEAFVCAVKAGDVPAEIRARELLGARLAGRAGATITASARLLARLSARDHDVAPVPGQDTESLLTNLELSPPTSDPRRRAAALLSSASLFDSKSSACALSLAGWNLLATGDTARAISLFRKYLEEYPEDIVGWEGLRAAAELSGETALLAEASAALGDLSSDAGQGAELWERAAFLLLDVLGDEHRGEEALSRAVSRDITRAAAFDRLFRIVRARRDGPRLLELISQRLAVTEEPEEIAKLYWERARVLRENGDSVGALEALESVTMLEPDHVGALALTGEIYITEKRFEEAAESLSRLAGLSEAPAQQRLMSGIAATDLYENKLGLLDRAEAVLLALYRAGLSTLTLRERLARLSMKLENWALVAELFEELMSQRETREGRIEAARLALGIRRDRLGTPDRAAEAAEKLLEEAPDDGDALDLVLAGHVKPLVAQTLLPRGRDAMIATLMQSPLDLDAMIRLSEIGRRLDDTQLRQVTLGAIVALGGQTPERLSELSALDRRIARTPQIAVDDAVVAGLREDGDRGAITELVSALATTFAEALGPGLAALGVTKKDRVRPQDGLPVRNEVAAWAGALGLGEFDFYVGGRDPEGIVAVATETPAVVIGSSVTAPLAVVHRQALARELLALRLGMTILRHRDPTDIAALVVAACNLGGVKLDSPPYAMLAEFERQLNKEMPRRVRKSLPEIAARVARERVDTRAWVGAARSTLDRMAAVAVGDVSWVLSSAEKIRRGDPPATTESKLRSARLLSFVLSPAFFAVREKLGMGVR